MEKKTYILVVVMALVVGLVIGACRHSTPTQKVITAEKFLLVDNEGKTRGDFSLSSTGSPRLRLFNKQGEKPRVIIRMLEGGDSGAVITAEKFLLMDNEEKMRGDFSLSSAGSPRLRLFDKKGETPRVIVGALERGDSGGVFLLDRERRNRAIFVVTAEGKGTLAFLDDELQPTWHAP